MNKINKKTITCLLVATALSFSSTTYATNGTQKPPESGSNSTSQSSESVYEWFISLFI